jgi:hypothetical protein
MILTLSLVDETRLVTHLRPALPSLIPDPLAVSIQICVMILPVAMWLARLKLPSKTWSGVRV